MTTVLNHITIIPYRQLFDMSDLISSAGDISRNSAVPTNVEKVSLHFDDVLVYVHRMSYW